MGAQNFEDFSIDIFYVELMARFFYLIATFVASATLTAALEQDAKFNECRDYVEEKIGEHIEAKYGGQVAPMLKAHDANKDGIAQSEEIGEAMRAAGIKEDCILPHHVIDHLDKDKNGHVEHHEL